MRGYVLCFSALVALLALSPGRAGADDAGAATSASTAPGAGLASDGKPGNGTSPAGISPRAAPTGAAKPGAKPATVKGKPAAKPSAPKLTAKDKQTTLKKKTRSNGPAHEPDPTVRRAVAGMPLANEHTRRQETPEMVVLREAERELFGLAPAFPPSRSSDPFRPIVVGHDRPTVYASGLSPPPLRSLEVPTLERTEPDWLSSLSQPEVPVRWNARVARYLSFYKNDPRGRSIVATWIQKSGAFEGMVRRILRTNELPEDLLWIALIESGFNPMAFSPAGAAGLWQLMPATARAYGLVVDRWVDERLDPERSTAAAAKFLADLHHRFGSWELALAAYNMGYGGLLTAVRKYNTNDFWELCRFEASLPWETTLYVPKILALAVVARNPAVFGLEGTVRDSPVEYDVVDVAPGVPVASIAASAQVDVRSVELLNPQLLASRTPPEAPVGRPVSLWAVRVPAHTGPKVARNLPKVRAQEQPLERYVVHDGEGLADIARARGVSVQTISKLNGFEPDDVLRSGTILLFPSASKGSQTHEAGEKPVVAVANDVQAPPGYRRLFYRVVAGDELAGVAEAFGVHVDDLRRWNLLDPNARLQESMTLVAVVPATRDLSGIVARGDDEVKVLVVGTDGFFEHHESLRDRVRTTLLIRADDTWQKIASRTGLSVATLERINRRSRHSALQPGERLVVYVPPRLAQDIRAQQPATETAKPGPLNPPSPDDLPELPDESETAPVDVRTSKEPGAHDDRAQPPSAPRM